MQKVASSRNLFVSTYVGKHKGSTRKRCIRPFSLTVIVHTFHITDYMKKISSWKADTSSASQLIPRIFWNR